MAEQTVMFVTGFGGREQPAEPIQARLLHRRDDPATSKAAAAKLQRIALSKSLALFLAMLGDKELTVREVAQHATNPDFWYVEWNKRVKAWSVAGHIELTGETRDGGRVWRAIARR